MPVVPKIQRTEAIEAKYNVTIEFPHLGLHSAAATGNLGLVKYALEHGQPINSVLDGVLPLHAACSGGNDLVVRLLIERGADVNAARLPRRYSSDKNRDTSFPVVGATGSTPLHFACANGHTPVVLTLLMHGAHPNRADKHGTTPEMLARQNGWIACAEVLQQWLINKDRDLREKEQYSSHYVDSGVADGPSKEERHLACSSSDCKICTLGKRVRMKRSIDHALNMLMPSLSHSHSSSTHSDTTVSVLEPIIASPLLSSEVPVESSLRTSDDTSTVEGLPPRRPSLPDVFDVHQTMPISRRAGPSSRRPRSAGTDAEPSSASHRVKGKVSLLNIFKKSNGDAIPTSESSSGYASPNSIHTSVTPSPVPTHRTATPVSRSSRHIRDDLSSPSPDTSPVDGTMSSRFRGRLFSEGESSASSHRPLALELHRALSDERLRIRSGPGQSLALPTAHRSPSVRPGILRPHNRSVSSGQSNMESPRSDSVGPTSRALRFDPDTPSTSLRSNDSRRRSSNSPARSVRAAKSISSIRSAVTTDSPQSPLRVTLEADDSGGVALLTDDPEDAAVLDEEEEDHYGEPIVSRVGVAELDTRLAALKVDDESKRLPIMSSQASISPLPSPGVVIPSTGFDGPFSINQPPPEDIESPTQPTFLAIHGVENRLRGDSMSSMSTTATSGYVTTPGLPQSQLPSPHVHSASTPPEIPSMDYNGRGRIQRAASSTGVFTHEMDPAVGSKTPPGALGIDIRSISSHAQAEALVQMTQQSILEMQDIETTYQPPADGTAFGRTPLSAKLAAYGESLAIERKFKEEEQRRNSSSTARSATTITPDGSPDPALGGKSSIRGLDRKFSLEERSHRNRTIRQPRMRRPHTSGGTSSSDMFPSPHRHGSASSVNVHQLPASGSQLTEASSLTEVNQRNGDFFSSLTPPRGLQPTMNMDLYVDSMPRLRRSRTPDPESEIATSASPTYGIPLSRVSTAPAQDGYLKPNRSMSNQERHAARANKLVKMGFSSPDSWQNTMPQSRSQTSQIASKQRFGGFKGFVQSLQLKGKS